MPMLPTQDDADGGAAKSGGRRPTVVAAPPSMSSELSAGPRRRMFRLTGNRLFNQWVGRKLTFRRVLGNASGFILRPFRSLTEDFD